MMKREMIFLFIFLSLILAVNVIAQEQLTVEGGGELEVDAGITPDSAFYFIDEFFDRFGSDLENREEKISEIKAMIEAGNIEDAKIALERYKEFANNLEKEVAPEEKDDADRSSEAIKRAVRKFEGKISDDEKEDFVDDIIDKENNIENAAEIAFKIRDLCEQLSKIDPVEYERICRVGDDEDAPEWKKKHYRDLTEEQRKEARAFGSIMGECFRTQGRECRCEEISIKPFADRCSVVAPLAAKCDGGDENACEAMDEATEGIEDLLPDYLSDVLGGLEDEFEEDQFEFHMPKECRERNARNPKECMKVMFEINAPDECREALENGEISFDNEKEARESCERIMFEINAPDECIEAGIKDPRECSIFMFKNNAPPECIEAGLTGEHRNDHKKCEALMGEKFGDRRGPSDHAVAAGFRCKSIENPEERLKCFDEALLRAGELGRGEGGQFGGWPPQCQEAQALTRESCEKIMRAWGESQRTGEEGKRRFEEKEHPYDCAVMFCSEGMICSPYRGCITPEERERELQENSGDYNPPKPGDSDYVDKTAKYDCSKLDCGPAPNYCDSWQGCVNSGEGSNPDGSSCSEGYEWSGSGCIPFGTGDYGFNAEENCGSGYHYENGICTPNEAVPESGTTTATTEGTSETASGTDAVITGNAFLEYYYK
ncbi:MAG: hypothetical protein AABX83_00960 [Nanoarchaeota archaeon]